MKHRGQGGYIGLLGLVLTVGLIGLFYYLMYVRPAAGTAAATSTATRVGDSSMAQDIDALRSAKAIQDVSAKRAAEINAQMQ